MGTHHGWCLRYGEGRWCSESTAFATFRPPGQICRTRRRFRTSEHDSRLELNYNTGQLILFYMYIPPSPISPRRLNSDCFSRMAPPCQGGGARTPVSSERHPCTCRIVVSGHIEPLMSSDVCGNTEMSLSLGIGMRCEGRRRSIASIWDVGSAATDTKAAQVDWMRLGGKNGTRKGL